MAGTSQPIGPNEDFGILGVADDEEELFDEDHLEKLRADIEKRFAPQS